MECLSISPTVSGANESLYFLQVSIYLSLAFAFTFHGNQRVDSVTQIDGGSDVLHQRNHAVHYPLLRQQLPQRLLPVAEHNLVFADIDELLQVRIQMLQNEDLTVLSQVRCYAG